MSDLKILVVEDDPVTLKVVEKRLAKAGYEVETAKTGIEAIGLVSERFFDVVLADIMMPGGVDGFGVLEATKGKWKQSEVILMTAYATVDDAVEAMKKGAADYLKKPVNFDELLIRLERVRSLKSITRHVIDLGEAMDVTEKAAAQTIRELETLVSDLQDSRLSAVRLLADQSMDVNERVRKAIEVLS
jgi:two-component system OmpR family response regulator